jgi:hypothetical protein
MREILMKRGGDHLKLCIGFSGMEHMGSHQEAKSDKRFEERKERDISQTIRDVFVEHQVQAGVQGPGGNPNSF